MSMIPQIKVELVLTNAEYEQAKGATASHMLLMFDQWLTCVDPSVYIHDDVQRSHKLLVCSLDHTTPRLQHAIFGREDVDLYVNRGYAVYRSIVNLVEDPNSDVIAEFPTYLACIRESMSKPRKTPPSHYRKVIETQVRFPLSDERLENIAFAIQTTRNGFLFPITKKRHGFAEGKQFVF